MRLKDLHVSWRQLLAEPAYSVVVVLGLAVAIAATYLIALLLNDRWLPDPAVPAPERIVRMEFKINIPGRADDWFAAAPFVFRDALLQATRAAERLFGRDRQDLIGQGLRLRGETLSVGAIVAPQAANSELDIDAMVSFDAPISRDRQAGLRHGLAAMAMRPVLALRD